MPALRIFCNVLMLVGILGVIFVAASRNGFYGDKSDFVLLLLAMGAVAPTVVPNLVGAVLPEKFIDEREAGRRASGDMAYAYRIMGEIGFLVLLIFGIILYRDGFRF